jgi:hypothetical protein
MVKKVLHYLEFVSNQFDTLRTSICFSSLENTRELLTSSTKRESSSSISIETCRSVQLGPVLGTALLHLAAFFGIIPANNTGYASIQPGLSGFYRCVDFLLLDDDDNEVPKNQSTLVDQVNGVLKTLNDLGRRVEMSDLDQLSCVWARENLGVREDGRRNDIIFLDGNKMVYLPMRAYWHSRQSYKAIQFLVVDKWTDLSDYFEISRTYNSKRWDPIQLKEGWKGGFLSSFRKKNADWIMKVTLFFNS